MSFSRSIVVLVLSLVASLAQAVEVRARLDRDTVHMGETVTLNVEAEGSGGDMPDFGALDADFTRLGTSSSNSINIVNGSTSAKQLWAVGLQPKHEGRIAIAPVVVGNARSEALTLTVLPAQAASVDHAGDEVFMEMSAEPTAPYVQQQVRVTVALFFSVNLAAGNLEDPHAEGAVVQKLGQDHNYRAQRGDRTYQVIERHYALIPEKSGPLLLPALNFRGRAVGNDPAAQFFGRGREVATRSDAIKLDVKPRPATAAAGPWLPAQTLGFTVQGPPAGTSARVGEPITLTLNLRAQGLGFEQLPELALPQIEGAEIYPDKPVTRTRDDGTWLFGESERKFAIVPTRAGTLRIPALSQGWWDTQHDRVANEQVAAQEIEVLPAIASNLPASPPMVQSSPALPAQGAISPASTATATNVGTAADSGNASALRRWRALAFGAIGLWLITLTIWWWMARRRDQGPSRAPAGDAAPSTSVRVARAAFVRACETRDLAAIARRVLAWAAAEGKTAPTSGALAAQLELAHQRDALAALERARFGQGDMGDACREMAKAFADGFVWRHAQPGTKSSETVLPRLYPQ